MNKRRLLIAPAVLGLALSMAACSQDEDRNTGAEPATSQAPDGELAGLWLMTSLEVGTEDDLQEIPYSGQIDFTTDTVSVQAMNPDTEAEDTE